MPTKKEEITTPNLSALIEALVSADIRFILVGGLAAVVQGAPVTTMDVDIVHLRSSENISKLFDFLQSMDAVYRRPDDKVIEPKKKDLFEMGHTLLTTRLGPLDVLAFVEEGKTYEDLLEHTIENDYRGHTVRVLRLEMLTELKKASNNPAEKQRLSVLEETLRQLKKS